MTDQTSHMDRYLTHSATAILEEDVKPIRYADEATVRSILRNMDDWRLGDAYEEGLRERQRGGPTDGDTARSARLLTMIAAEMDRRADLGIPWQGPLDPPGSSDGN